MIKKILLIAIFFFGQIVLAAPDVNIGFFDRFGDTYLSGYINQAVENNNDLKIAAARVEQSRQQVKISFASELPSLSFGADYLGVHIPKFDNFTLNNNAFVMPFIVSYEPDFLLKNRDKTRSADKRYEADLELEKSVYISLLSDVANSYINILEYDYLIKNQKMVLALAEENLWRTQKTFMRGVVDANVLNQEKQNVEKEKNTLNQLQKQQNIILNNFCVLVGVSPNCSLDLKRGKLAQFEYENPVPSQISSDVIFSRPDVIAAEKELEKAKIDVRVARKEFLPSFNITGLWVFNTIAQGNFFSWQNSLAALFAGATMDIFKGGKKVAFLRLQKAKYEELFEKYRLTDLNATKEVNTALCVIKFDTKIDENTKNQLNLAKMNFKNIQKKYERGVISYPQLLKENIKMLNIEQNQVQTKATRLANYITLYKAVGGKL
ncbi:MAG: TolC family protein [Candidatus Gastranaerophilales bacterium]|nr:TolC family protein [Candidatus Gastranaerophilales bacterium]